MKQTNKVKSLTLKRAIKELSQYHNYVTVINAIGEEYPIADFMTIEGANSRGWSYNVDGPMLQVTLYKMLRGGHAYRQFTVRVW